MAKIYAIKKPPGKQSLAAEMEIIILPKVQWPGRESNTAIPLSPSELGNNALPLSYPGHGGRYSVHRSLATRTTVEIGHMWCKCLLSLLADIPVLVPASSHMLTFAIAYHAPQFCSTLRGVVGLITYTIAGWIAIHTAESGKCPCLDSNRGSPS